MQVALNDLILEIKIKKSYFPIKTNSLLKFGSATSKYMRFKSINMFTTKSLKILENACTTCELHF